MGVVAAVFSSLAISGFLHVLKLPISVGAVVLSLVFVVALMLMQSLWYARDSERLRSPLGYALLGAQTCLVYLPILVFGQAWVGMPGFLAGSVLLVLRPLLAWTVFCFVVASMGFAQWVFTAQPVDVMYTTLTTVSTGLVVYGLSRLTALVAEVHASRAEIARMAVLRERLRFARDLHDLLGYSLSAITLKIELTHRLMEKAPKQASDQLLEILEISRLALSDARTVASGYRELSLEEECRSAMSVLSAADVTVRLDSDHTDLPVQVSTVLATVLREGVTNLLRHSKAKRCDIVIRQTDELASLEITNDDLLPRGSRPDDHGEGGGGGLHNLTVRAKEIGGAVRVEREANLFRLYAEVPIRMARHLHGQPPPRPTSGAAAPAGSSAGSEPAGLPRDPDGVDPVSRGQLADDGGQVVPDGAD